MQITMRTMTMLAAPILIPIIFLTNYSSSSEECIMIVFCELLLSSDPESVFFKHTLPSNADSKPSTQSMHVLRSRQFSQCSRLQAIHSSTLDSKKEPLGHWQMPLLFWIKVYAHSEQVIMSVHFWHPIGHWIQLNESLPDTKAVRSSFLK